MTADIPTAGSKKIINNRIFLMQTAIPTIIKGKDIALHLTAEKVVRIPFEFDGHVCFLDIGIQSEAKKETNKIAEKDHSKIKAAK
jgi:hypothetical protein